MSHIAFEMAAAPTHVTSSPMNAGIRAHFYCAASGADNLDPSTEWAPLPAGPLPSGRWPRQYQAALSNWRARATASSKGGACPHTSDSAMVSYPDSSALHASVSRSNAGLDA